MNKIQQEFKAWLGPVPFLSLALLTVIALVFFFSSGGGIKLVDERVEAEAESLDERVMPSEGIALPIQWNALGLRLTESGSIDKEKFMKLYEGRGGISEADLELIESSANGEIIMTRENSGLILNLLWAFGLANENPVLEEGPMANPNYGGAGGFASTGGWTLAYGDPMDHYSAHAFVRLSSEQQALVENTAKGIFRPCCGNSTHFPDCNHGMAMLGLLELLAKEGLSEDEVYDIALKVNSYWFPETYMTLASYFDSKGVKWANVDAKTVLGYDYSSGAGYSRILAEMDPVEIEGGGGCSA